MADIITQDNFLAIG